MRLRAAVGALAERNFRLLFASSTISGLGDGISVVALVFAALAMLATVLLVCLPVPKAHRPAADGTL